ncbi:MAG: murein biosynthesis integral membrane protein MurJ [Clostridia bacterium]|nr:murein biosynthesis integral membrane protein MurJ [Clostridia bacterium]
MDGSIKKKVFNGAVIIAVVSIIAKLTTFAQEAVLAAYIGTTFKSDAYHMVSSIQMVIYPMVSVGIWKVFLPLYKEKVTHNRIDEANRFANKVITFYSIIAIALVALIMIFTGAVVSLVAPGFEGETRELTIELVRISAPMYITVIGSAVYAAMLQCHNRFFGAQIREVVSHIPTLVAAIFFYRRWGIQALAYALIIGGFLRLVIELFFVNWGYRYKPDFRFKDDDMGKMMKRLPYVLIIESVTKINSLIDKAMASGLPEGTISCLSYASKLTHVFSGLLSTAISTALYPQMIELIALKKQKELSNLVVKTVDIFAVMMIPLTTACILFRTEVVSAAFGRGAFSAESVALTAGIFAVYCVAFFSSATNGVLNNIFYGHGNTKVPMILTIIGVVANVGLNLVFIRLWGAIGLAVTTSSLSIVMLFVRFRLTRKYVSLNLKRVLTVTAKVLLISLISCGIPRLLFSFVHLNKYLTLVISAVMAVPLYYLGCRLLKITELDDIIQLFFAKFKRRKNKASA